MEPKTRLYFDTFSICSSCQRIYWQGSHSTRLSTFISAVRRCCCRLHSAE
ncbi:Mut7-C RNAse domain-containing protein [Prosthecochloris ethylica]